MKPDNLTHNFLFVFASYFPLSSQNLTLFAFLILFLEEEASV